MREDTKLQQALAAQRRRAERVAAERLAVAVVAPDPAYAARLIDGVLEARRRGDDLAGERTET